MRASVAAPKGVAGHWHAACNEVGATRTLQWGRSGSKVRDSAHHRVYELPRALRPPREQEQGIVSGGASLLVSIRPNPEA